MDEEGGGRVNEDVRRIIEDALCNLSRAVNALTGAPRSRMLLPRPREFRFCQGVCWPKIDDGAVDFSAVCVTSTFPLYAGRAERSVTLRVAYNVNWTRDISPFVIERCRTPHELVTALHNIRAATAWCEARTAGLLRHAQEISSQRR